MHSLVQRVVLWQASPLAALDSFLCNGTEPETWKSEAKLEREREKHLPGDAKDAWSKIVLPYLTDLISKCPIGLLLLTKGNSRFWTLQKLPGSRREREAANTAFSISTRKARWNFTESQS